MDVPVLWHFPVSHYNEKARWALDWKAVPHRRVALGPSYLIRAPLRTGRAKTPVLFLEGRAIGDSSRIIEALERAYPDPALYPSDPDQRRRALELEDWFDEEVGGPLRALFAHALFEAGGASAAEFFTASTGGAGYRLAFRAMMPAFQPFYRWRHAVNAEQAELGRERIEAALDRIEAELSPEGYLVGDRFGVADLTAAALLYGIARPAEFPYPTPEPPPAFAAVVERLADRRAVRWIHEMYRRHRGKSAEIG